MYRRIIFCNCGGGAIDENVKKQILDQLPTLNTEKIKLDDLCGLSATNKDQVKEVFSSVDKTFVIACHPRAVKLLLDYAGVKSYDNLAFLNLRGANAGSALETISDLCNVNLSNQTITEISSTPDWPAWYPTLDYSRCTACGQCADFCLFGVYKKQDGTVEVINPTGCKNNCPACARICPQTAIVFPKYQRGGAISGADSFDEISEQKRQVDDLNQILGGDIYLALEQRKARRRSIINSEALNKAIEERNLALKEIKS
jgi:Pyruvate/2-oxoacid:ferredoxin oxidoreductase delta subunit